MTAIGETFGHFEVPEKLGSIHLMGRKTSNAFLTYPP